MNGLIVTKTPTARKMKKVKRGRRGLKVVRASATTADGGTSHSVTKKRVMLGQRMKLRRWPLKAPPLLMMMRRRVHSTQQQPKMYLAKFQTTYQMLSLPKGSRCCAELTWMVRLMSAKPTLEL